MGTKKTLGVAARAAVVAIGYAVASGAYIVLSSAWAGDVAPNPETQTATEIIKGLGFVLVTALLLFVAMRHHLRRLVSIERELAAVEGETARAHYATNVAEIAAALAHEMKNMVGAMRLNVDLLLTTTTSNEQRESLEDLSHAIQRLDTLSRDLMQRATRTDSPRDETWFALDELARDCVQLVGLVRRRHQCKIELRAEPVEALADRRDLEQVILNLLTNAVDATDARGHVRLQVHGADSPIALSVEDDGPGVPRDLTERVFEPLFSTKASRGSGVGLAVSRRLLDRSDGNLTLARPEDGRGARFEVALRTRHARRKAD